MGKDKGRWKDRKRKRDREEALRAASSKLGKMPRKDSERELRRMQTELCRLPEWVKQEKEPVRRQVRLDSLRAPRHLARST